MSITGGLWQVLDLHFCQIGVSKIKSRRRNCGIFHFHRSRNLGTQAGTNPFCVMRRSSERLSIDKAPICGFMPMPGPSATSMALREGYLDELKAFSDSNLPGRRKTVTLAPTLARQAFNKEQLQAALNAQETHGVQNDLHKDNSSRCRSPFGDSATN